jgi:tetratricopeptide (TPR) repeat protein
LLIYLDTADFIAAAQKAGRVVTAEDFDKKRLAAIDSAPPLDQAKWRLSLRQFDKARDLAATALAAAPEKDRACAEALLIMGLLHESCCLDEPDKAMECYARLAAMEDDPAAALAGLAHQYRMHLAAGRAAEALEVGRAIERRYPRNSFREALARYNRQLARQTKGKPQ